jgi:hypothetical protein
MHNIYDIKSIYRQIYLYIRWSVKMGIQNTNFKVINQHDRNGMCDVYSLEEDFYLGTPSYFYNVFTHISTHHLLLMLTK